MSPTQPLGAASVVAGAPAGTVNCQSTKISLDLSSGVCGSPDIVLPVNGMVSVCGVVVTSPDVIVD